jgi:hypothetical protein
LLPPTSTTDAAVPLPIIIPIAGPGPETDQLGLRGFVPLPGPGRLDPYNLGVNWPLEPRAWPDTWDSSHETYRIAGRAGWWATSHTGSQTYVGEWQSLQPSAFLDLDGLITDGTRTANFFADYLDDSASQARLQFYGPNMRANIDFEQYLHRLQHDPLFNIPSGAPVSEGGVYKQDLNTGDDYAFRVEQLRGGMVTDLTENLRFRVEAFQMRKFGDRQAEAVAHCYTQSGVTGRNCHLLSQSQHVDWETMEVTPYLEWHSGPLVLEYFRLMRRFTQNDQTVSRDYNLPSTGIAGGNPGFSGTWPYAVVPDVTTQMDQLRMHLDMADRTKLYTYTYYGRMDNYDRDIHRNIFGWDTRLTDSTLQGLTMTAYAKGYYQDGNSPSALLPDETQGFTMAQALAKIRSDVEDHQTTAGFRSRFQPGFSAPFLDHLAFTAGYQYDILNRYNATWNQSDGAFSFSQPSTITHTISLGVQQPWTDTVDSYARYKLLFVSDPLYGFSSSSGTVNSALPKERHILDLGAGWYPLVNFGVSANQQFDIGWLRSDVSQLVGNQIHFDEQSYASTVTVWYAPIQKLALTSSFALMSNWINQNVVLGDDYPGGSPGNPSLVNPVTRPWYYYGTNTVATCRADYRYSRAFRFYAGYEYVRGMDSIENRGFTDLWPDLGVYSQVFVETHRVLAGADWKPTEHLTIYNRYILNDYHDIKTPQNSGLVHMYLAGLSLIW